MIFDLLAATTLQERFARVAAQHADRVALRDGASAWTYADLDTWSGEIAAEILSRLAVEEGCLEGVVGVALHRSPALYAAILGILRSGAAYVSLNPDDPVSRQEHILCDSGAVAVLRESNNGLVVEPLSGGRDSHGVATADTPGERLAYIIYTSGSTGTPKGVPVLHQDVLALLASGGDQFGFGSADVWSLLHACSFDISVWEMWGAFGFGGAAVVVPPAVVANSYALAQTLAHHRVTVLTQVPTAFAALVGALRRRPVDLSSVRHLVLAGEQARSVDIEAWRILGLAPRSRVTNMYGATEGTVHSTVVDVTDPSGMDDGHGGTLVGVPMSHQRLRVVREDMTEVSTGTLGELQISGLGVTRGYLGRPDLNRERFVTDQDGRMWYSTGDQGYFDGRDYWCRGRLDDQVKVRGYRIELGEVEMAIRAAPEVQNCVAFVSEDPPRCQLVALVVPEPATSVKAVTDVGPALRDHLARILPQYMIPSALVPVAELFLTASGKPDRRAAERFWREGAATSHPGHAGQAS